MSATRGSPALPTSPCLKFRPPPQDTARGWRHFQGPLKEAPPLRVRAPMDGSLGTLVPVSFPFPHSCRGATQDKTPLHPVNMSPGR